MPRVRLLLISLMACSALTFAQQAPDSSASRPAISQPSSAAAFNLEAKSDSEPWRIIPESATRSNSAQDRMKFPALGEQQGQNRQKKKFVWQSTPNSDAQTFALSPEGDPADATCFTIRSYVVARDSKYSDSTHPVGYSTCHPARRYGLKKVETSR
jgi:hypothetical protein